MAKALAPSSKFIYSSILFSKLLGKFKLQIDVFRAKLSDFYTTTLGRTNAAHKYVHSRDTGAKTTPDSSSGVEAANLVSCEL
jgi:hypothetical protein